MARVSYDGKLIEPAPIITIDRQHIKTGDNATIGANYNIVINGTLLPHMGSPRSDRSFWTSPGSPPEESLETIEWFPSLIRKKEALRQLFATDGLTLLIQPLDASQSMTIYPRVQSISFSDELWAFKVQYTITLEADQILPDLGADTFDEYLESATETWNIETDTQNIESPLAPRTYILTHTLEAQGKRHFTSDGLQMEAWRQAQNWVLPRLGFDSAFALSSGVNSLPSYYGGFNHTRSENLDKGAGTFSVVETWILTSGNALEEYEVTTETTLDNNTSVRIQGQIQGLELRTNDMVITQTKYGNASGYFDSVQNQLYNRAKTYSGVNLNPIPIETSIGRHPGLGTIAYGYTYNNRPSNIIDGAKSESIIVTEDLQSDIFAEIPILGRTTGALLQGINTKTPKRRTLNIECIFEPSGFGGGTVADIRNTLIYSKPTGKVADIIEACDPSNMGATKSFKGVNEEDWSATNGSYRRTIVWIWE